MEESNTVMLDNVMPEPEVTGTEETLEVTASEGFPQIDEETITSTALVEEDLAD